MLLSAIEFLDMLSEKRRSVIAAASLATCFLILTIVSPILNSHHASIESHIRSSSSPNQSATQGIEESPDAITNAMSQMADDAGSATRTIEAQSIGSVMTVASGITRVDSAVAHDAYATTTFTLHITGDIFFGTMHGIGFVDTATLHGIGFAAMATVHGIGDAFSFTDHTIGHVFGFFSGITHVAALIHPKDHTPTPTITQIRMQQAAIIQSGTKDAVLALMSDGTGGACDNGSGNGSYPLGWCNAPMDSIATISYSSDPINRECTSYAYWYFTVVEGHTNFKAWGNAKYWATTSNYPTHSTPVVGAMAVETAGAYGHIAIVQALPGQEFAGQTVPSRYVLVSEMNYDWSGHFRYSYSPLNKFSAYIYE